MMIPSIVLGISSSSRPIVVIGGGTDNTPDAVNWTNTSAVRPAKGAITVTTIGQQITGIASSINLTVTNSTSLRIGDLRYGVNSTNNSATATYTSIIAGSPITATVSSSFSVSNNQWLFFRYLVGPSPGGYGAGTTTLTVTNTSDSNTILDTWVHTNT